MAYTKYSLTPSSNTAAPPDGAPEGMLPSAVNDTMRDMMAQIRDCGDGIRGGTYTMTAPVITGGSINGTTIGATTASTGKFSTLTNAALTSGRVTYAGTSGVLQDDADFTFNGTTVTMANDASISGLTVGKGGGAVATNTAVGFQAMLASATGTNNTALGIFANYAVTSGSANTGIGSGANASVTSGNDNTAVGQAALNNSTGSSNTAVGRSALASNTTASNNTAVGYQAGYSNTTGTQQVAVGRQSLYTNTTGTLNTAVGDQSLYANTTGGSNTAIGLASMILNTTGSFNTALGRDSLFNNTTASNNTAVGYQALYSHVNSDANSQNTALGYRAGYLATNYNGTFVGGSAGLNATTGIKNTFVGYGAGSDITTGSKSTILGGYGGNSGGLDIRTASNYIVLSDGDGNPRAYTESGQEWSINANSGSPYSILNFRIAAVLKTQQYYEVSTSRFIIQNSSAGVYLAAGGTSWTSNSDERKKDIIEPITGAVDKIDTLRTVIGKYKTDEEGTRRPFLIAQDVQAVFPEAVDAQNPDDLGVAYSDMIPLLVAAIKELNAKVEAQALEIATLKGN
jgi:hypothetical protein